MKKLAIVTLVFFVLSVSIYAQKTNKVFIELTRVMVTSSPSGNIEYKKATFPCWQITDGDFVYISEKQLFIGKFKYYNFSVNSNKTGLSWMGVNEKASRKEKRRIEKQLLRAIKARR